MSCAILRALRTFGYGHYQYVGLIGRSNNTKLYLPRRRVQQLGKDILKVKLNLIISY
jgi:hypothetical protein